MHLRGEDRVDGVHGHHALLPYGNDGEALAEKVLEIVKDGQAIHDWKGKEVDEWKKAPSSFLEHLNHVISRKSNWRYA